MGTSAEGPGRTPTRLRLPVLRTIGRPAGAELLLAAAADELDAIDRALQESELAYNGIVLFAALCTFGDVRELAAGSSGRMPLDRTDRPRYRHHQGRHR